MLRVIKTRNLQTTASSLAARRRSKVSLISDEDQQKLQAIQKSNANYKIPEKNISSQAQERKVSTTSLGRMMTFAPLVATMAADLTGSKLGIGKRDTNLKLQEGTTEKMVEVLSRARGAALKIAQVISIQDNSVVPKSVTDLFDRVRESADYMPQSQIESQFTKYQGDNWRNNYVKFEDKPFAAASIGQVHRATIADPDNASKNVEVAIKVQYPGVGDSIDSDVRNLKMVLPFLGLPEGIYPEMALEVAQDELHLEVDYEREARCQIQMAEYFKDDDLITIPKVYPHLSSKEILVTEYMKDSLNIDKCTELDQETRNFIARHLVRICLEQLFTLKFMQTDPNWGNYMWNGKNLIMIDFGATQSYDAEFIDTYIKIINAAVHQDSETILKESVKIGFLTGFESKEMNQAHVDSILILGEFLRSEKPYNFKDQDISKRIARDQIPKMIDGRLCHPPKQTYSIHRALAGVFLAASKLEAEIVSLDLWNDVWDKYEFSTPESQAASSQAV